MVAPAVCEGHVRRSLVRLPGGLNDITAGAMVVDLSRGSSLAAMVPVSPFLDPGIQPHRPPPNSSTTPGKVATPLPWATTGASSQVLSPTTANGTTSPGQNTQTPPARAPVHGLTPPPSPVQWQHPRSVAGITTQGLSPRNSTSRGLTQSVSSGYAVQIPCATANTGFSIRGPLVTPTTGATSQRMIRDRRGSIARGTNGNLRSEAAHKKPVQRATAAITTTLTGKRKLESETNKVPVRNVSRPAKVTRTENNGQSAVPCTHNPQLAEENHRLRQVVQILMQQVGAYRQALRRSEAVRTGVAVS